MYFDELCMINPDLIDILTGISSFDFMGSQATNVLDWGILHIDGPLTDNDKSDLNLYGRRVVPSRVFSDGMRFQSVYFSNDDDLPVVFDTGASISVSPCKQDFILWEETGDLHTQLHGISGSTNVLGVGLVHWTVRDDKGRCRSIQTRAYYVPSAHVRLLSPQWYLYEQKSGTFMITPSESIFIFPGDKQSQLTFSMWNDNGMHSDLPIAYIVQPPTDRENEYDKAYLQLNVLDPENVNLTLAQKDLMLWHF